MSHSASAMTPDNAGNAIVCPECGRSRNDRSNPKIPSLFHWRRTMPVIILLVALASLGVWLKTGSQTFRSGSGSLYPRLVEPGISRADLQAIADGERTDIALTQAVVEASTRRWGGYLPGEPQLDVGFVSPRGARIIRKSVGWPLAWLTTTEHHNYENPITREGLRLVRTDPNAAAPGPNVRPNDPLNIHARPRMQWRDWRLHFQPAPEDVGGIERTSTLSLPGVAVSLGIVIVVWWLTAIALFAVNVFRNERFEGWRIKIAIAGMTILALVLAGLYTREYSEDVSIRVEMDRLLPRAVGTASTMMVRRGFVYPGVSQSQLHAMLEQPDGDALLAQKILDALENAPPRESSPRFVRNEQGFIEMLPQDDAETVEGYLAVVFQDETVMDNADLTSMNPTLTLVQVLSKQYLRRPDFGEAEHVAAPAGWRFEMQHNNAMLRWSPGVADESTITYMFNLERIGLVIVALAALWIIAAFICSGIPRLIVKRHRRMGRCIACGYQMHIPA